MDCLFCGGRRFQFDAWLPAQFKHGSHSGYSKFTTDPGDVGTLQLESGADSGTAQFDSGAAADPPKFFDPGCSEYFITFSLITQLENTVAVRMTFGMVVGDLGRVFVGAIPIETGMPV